MMNASASASACACAARASASFTAAMAAAFSSSSAFFFFSSASLTDSSIAGKKAGSWSSSSSSSSPASGAPPPLVLPMVALHASFTRRWRSHSASHALNFGPLIGLSGGSSWYQRPPRVKSRSFAGTNSPPSYLQAARRLPAADLLQKSRQASSTLSGERDRFDPLAGEAVLRRRESMQVAAGGMRCGGATNCSPEQEEEAAAHGGARVASEGLTPHSHLRPV
ncbi:uncharacterized protein [Lolium perenne]|uniref:uncharacterized protein n=1 Tax=Lolium perenne TaxID=4522 RepID=UPI003A994BE9